MARRIPQSGPWGDDRSEQRVVLLRDSLDLRNPTSAERTLTEWGHDDPSAWTSVVGLALEFAEPGDTRESEICSRSIGALGRGRRTLVRSTEGDVIINEAWHGDRGGSSA